MLGGFSHPSEEIRDGKRGKPASHNRGDSPLSGESKRTTQTPAMPDTFGGGGLAPRRRLRCKRIQRELWTFQTLINPGYLEEARTGRRKAHRPLVSPLPASQHPPFPAALRSRVGTLGRPVKASETVRSWACPVLTVLPLPFANQSYSHPFSCSRDRSGKLCGGAERRRRPGSSAEKRLRLFLSPGQDAARTSSTPSRPHASIFPQQSLNAASGAGKGE